jgi:hypothetical protein
LGKSEKSKNFGITTEKNLPMKGMCLVKEKLFLTLLKYHNSDAYKAWMFGLRLELEGNES